MIKIKINGKEYEMPQSWDEITMKQYCHLFYNLPKASLEASEGDRIRETLKNEGIIISRLLGENDDFVLGLPVKMFSLLQHHAMFIYSIDNFLNSGAFTIKIDGRRYEMTDVDKMSLRQYIDSDMIMKEEGENQFIELLACLLTPIDGGYDGRYEELIPKIENLKASEGLPFIYTFFKKKELSKKLSEACSKVEDVADQLVQHTQNS